MAGFGFTFEYDNDALELVRRLLRHCQRQARYFRVELKYRINRDHFEYLVMVDGPLRGMQALGTRLWMEVPLLADWYEKPKPAWRRTDAGFALLEGYAEGLRDITASSGHAMTRIERRHLSKPAPMLVNCLVEAVVRLGRDAQPVE